MDGALGDGVFGDDAFGDGALGEGERGSDDALPPRFEARSAADLCTVLRPGDVLLVGHEGPTSRITQWVTASDYGHAIFYVGEGQFLESTDRSFTPIETDDGVYRVSAEKLFDKLVDMTSAVVLRPDALDPQRVRRVAEHMAERAAPYPTVSIPMIGFSCLLARSFHRLPGLVRRPVANLIVFLVADGVSRMHCTELVMRIYAALGQPIELRNPVLGPVLEAAKQSRPSLSTSGANDALDLPPRLAEPGRWPRRPVTAAAMATVWLVVALRARLDRGSERRDQELTVPSDLAESDTFKVAIPLNCDRP